MVFVIQNTMNSISILGSLTSCSRQSRTSHNFRTALFHSSIAGTSSSSSLSILLQDPKGRVIHQHCGDTQTSEIYLMLLRLRVLTKTMRTILNRNIPRKGCQSNLIPLRKWNRRFGSLIHFNSASIPSDLRSR